MSHKTHLKSQEIYNHLPAFNVGTRGSYDVKFGHNVVSMHIFQSPKRHPSTPNSFYAMMEYVLDLGARQSSTHVYAAAYAAAVVHTIPKKIWAFIKEMLSYTLPKFEIQIQVFV